MKTLPTELLRSFVAVVDEGGFSAAGALLGRSQPAVSLQIQRLQELLSAELLRRAGRGFVLTDDGQILLSYARPMLRLNDEALARLSKSGVAGVVRLGVPNEYADSFLPAILGRFAQRYPDIAIEVGCELSTHLLAKLERAEYDLVFGLHAHASSARGKSKAQLNEQSWSEKLLWVGSPQHPVPTHDLVPLIVAPAGCVYRQRMLETLEGLGRPWRIVYTSPSFGGIKAGVLAGLGVTVLAASTVPEGLAILGGSAGLPSLADIRVALHYDRASATEAVRVLASFMAERLG